MFQKYLIYVKSFPSLKGLYAWMPGVGASAGCQRQNVIAEAEDRSVSQRSFRVA